jgi:hypothetical protein
MTPPAVHVTITRGPADAAQLEAWRALWKRLLRPKTANPIPAATEMGHETEARASAHDGGPSDVTTTPAE